MNQFKKMFTVKFGTDKQLQNIIDSDGNIPQHLLNVRPSGFSHHILDKIVDAATSKPNSDSTIHPYIADLQKIKNLQPHHIDKIIERAKTHTNELPILAAFAHRENLPEKHSDYMVSHPDARVRIAIASKPNLSDIHKEKLVNDKFSDVRQVVASQADLKPHLENKLANDPVDFVRHTFISSGNRNRKHIEQFLKGSTDDKVAVLDRNDLKPEDLEDLYKEDVPVILRRVAIHKNTPEHILNKMKTEHSGNVLGNLATNNLNKRRDQREEDAFNQAIRDRGV